MNSDKAIDEFDNPEMSNSKRIIKCRSQCLICGKNISGRRNLVRHLRRVHCIEPLVRKPQFKCSFNDCCTFLCATSQLLREHLKSTHDFNVEKKVLNFKCRSDFEKWKQEEEINTNARYVSYTGTKSRGTKKVYYLKCHRSGKIRLESNEKERKRSRPTKGYTQCGTTCPSSIQVAETESGSIQAMYYPVHLGHSLDDESIKYMKLTLKEKEEIVGKLAQGEPVGKIVSDSRKRKGSKLSRINLLQRRDVYNIKQRVNYLEKEKDHDWKIIDSWIESLGLKGNTEGKNDFLAFYSPMGKTKDYTLVIIHQVQKMVYSVGFDDSIVYVKTKKGKPNLDFNLTAVSVICENGEGCPIAFCISRKVEYSTLFTFFKVLLQNFGVIKAQIFVSDNFSPYYSAWKTVMGECDSKLICNFDIESIWEEKLTAFKCPVNKQKEASRRLKSLLRQRDKDVFESELIAILNDWEEDEEMRNFGRFFRKFHAKKYFEWATCYRIHSIRKESINNYLEPINETLDSIYVESYQSLLNSLNRLFAWVRDVCFLKLLKWDEIALSEKMRETERNHGESARVEEVAFNGSEWVVRDEDSDYYHSVRRNDSECDKKCGLICGTCGICVHDYDCDCTDQLIGFNICRHVHAVAISKEKKTEKEAEKSRELAVSDSRNSAVALAKSLAADLDGSNLTKEEYEKICTKISLIRGEMIKNNFVHDQFQELS